TTGEPAGRGASRRAPRAAPPLRRAGRGPHGGAVARVPARLGRAARRRRAGPRRRRPLRDPGGGAPALIRPLTCPPRRPGPAAARPSTEGEEPHMGRVVDFEALPYRETAPGVRRAPITGGDMKEMSAEVVRLAPGATLAESVPRGSDVYLFTLTGAIDVSGAGSKRRVEQDSFVTVQEG